MFILMSISTFAQSVPFDQVLTEKEIEDVAFDSVDTPPIFPGCEKERDSEK